MAILVVHFYVLRAIRTLASATIKSHSTGCSHKCLFYLEHFVVFFKSMFPKVSHVEVNIELLNTFVYVLLNILLKSFKDFDELYKILRRFTYGVLLQLLFYQLLIFGVLLLNVIEQMFEERRIINDQLVNYRPMNILTGKLVLVTLFYDLGHFREVSRDCFGILVDYESVMADYVLEELSVIWQVFEQGLEFLGIVLTFKVVTRFLDQLFYLLV